MREINEVIKIFKYIGAMEKIVNPLKLNRPPKQPYIGAERIRGGRERARGPTGDTSTTRAH